LLIEISCVSLLKKYGRLDAGRACADDKKIYVQ